MNTLNAHSKESHCYKRDRYSPVTNLIYIFISFYSLRLKTSIVFFRIFQALSNGTVLLRMKSFSKSTYSNSSIYLLCIFIVFVLVISSVASQFRHNIFHLKEYYRTKNKILNKWIMLATEISVIEWHETNQFAFNTRNLWFWS